MLTGLIRACVCMCMCTLLCVCLHVRPFATISGPMVGHVGDGNFHIFFPVDEKNPKELDAIKDISHKMCL